MNVSADDLSEISAKSAIVIDGETGDVLFEKNAYERRPMASTTKIMSVLLVLESGEDLDKQFVVDSEAIKVEGSSMGLQDGDKSLYAIYAVACFFQAEMMLQMLLR